MQEERKILSQDFNVRKGREEIEKKGNIGEEQKAFIEGVFAVLTKFHYGGEGKGMEGRVQEQS